MSASSSHVATSTPEAADRALLRHLKHPWENAALLACVVANVGLVVLGFFAIDRAGAWLERHPALGASTDVIKGWAIALLFALPLAVLGRHVTYFRRRANGVRVSADQLPEIHALLVQACARLRMPERPELYIVRDMEGFSDGHSVFGMRSAVVLNETLFIGHWRKDQDAIAFAIAGALGSIRLGHTRWWVELLTAYVVRMPVLRGGILAMRTYSRDRCAAWVVPDGIRGLIIHASGKNLVGEVDVAAFAAQACAGGGFWEWFAALGERTPNLTKRARALYANGFFDRERDLARISNI